MKNYSDEYKRKSFLGNQMRQIFVRIEKEYENGTFDNYQSVKSMVKYAMVSLICYIKIAKFSNEHVTSVENGKVYVGVNDLDSFLEKILTDIDIL